MPANLTHNAYGKNLVRLTKVVRSGARHDLFEITADIRLEGDFDDAYLHGDNRKVIATDSMKNTVYVLAKEQSFDSIEQFALILVRHFLDTYAQVEKATAELTQSSWQRIELDGQPQDHAFTSAGPQRRYALAVLSASATEPQITGGMRDLLVLKTTASEWHDFVDDRYTTLKDTHDRILATKIDADWVYHSPAVAVDFPACCRAIDDTILRTFATHYSLGVQQTLMAMGEAALAACNDIDSIHFELPNMHRIPFNLEPFGLKFENDIFIATDEPHGLITGTIARSK
jgi:urate oxidase